MEDKVSIIVPVYNVEKYLEKCLESIIKQTYLNLEILIIDDGSTDNSLSICNQYRDMDQRVCVIHKKNGGLSDARNVGIKNSTGKYICFVDSDDYIEKDYVKTMYQQIKKNKADICCCGKIIESPKKRYCVNSGSDFVVNSKEALKFYLLKNEIDNSAVDKLYRKELFEGIEFPVGRYYEDIGTIYKVFLKADRIVHVKDPLYHYVMREGSISHEEYSDKQIDSFYMTKEAVICIENTYPELKEYADAYYALEIVSTVRRIYHQCGTKVANIKYGNIIDEYQKNYEIFIRNQYVPFIKKIMMWLIKHRLYQIVDVVFILLNKM